VNGLTERELASLAWIGLAVGSALFWRPMQNALTDIVGALLNPAFLLPLALLGLYTAALVGLASLTPAWNLDLLKDTLIWFFTVGVVLMVRAANDATKDGWFLRQALATVRPTILLEFYLNLHGLPFWGEFALQGWLLLLILVDAAVQLDKIRGGESLVGFGRAVHWLQAITILALLSYVGIWLMGTWASIDLVQSLRESMLPTCLTLFTLPFLFGWVWYLNWDTARRQLGMAMPRGSRLGFRTRLAMLLGYGLSLHRPFMGNAWGRQLIEAPTLRAKLRVIGEQRARRRREAQERRRKAEDLVRYAGSPGTDAEGRRLDRREFAATIRALELMSSAQMGWYHNEPAGSYKTWPDAVLSALTRGLPAEHGITLKVSADGQRWYAWRRTVSGWVFAAGSAGPPPDQRFYDGEEPPEGFPGSNDTWGHFPFERGPNWES
jgi:hypothetical protein